jgi:putative ATPase
MDLFENQRLEQARKNAPLADRIRPRDLDEFLGQEDIVGPGKVLRRSIEADRIPSMILWGPPGSGKTTLARIIARRTRAHFEQISAVTSGVSDLRRLIAEAKERVGLYRKKSIVFIDEIHRFNKAQQDALLPFVEDGTVTLIGATTENPYFGVNPALVSRTQVFRLRPLDDAEIRTLVHRALEDKEAGLGTLGLLLEPDALEHMVMVANGDSRAALNALELAAGLAAPDSAGVRRITLRDAVDAVQQRALTYDKDGDQHYDTVSAFIKSMRGTDPDAALYWMARMLYAGEDPRFIARRIVICAAEDVGNADPMALVVAMAAVQAVEYVGLPEGRILLAQAATYVACAPKSNAALGIDEAMKDVAEGPPAVVPLHLRDTSYKGAKRFGNGLGYKYPHEYPGHWTRQQYLPDACGGKVYYHPSEMGSEAGLKQRLDDLRKTV